MTTNILIHGDSIFRGVVFDTQKEKYIYADNRIENQLAPIIDAKIINKSQFGNTVSRSAQKLAFNLEKYSPKFVIIELGGNDCDYDWKKVAQSPTQAHISNTDFPAFKVALREMIQTVRSYDIQPILSTIPPIDAERFFKWIVQQNGLSPKSILDFIGDVSRIYWWQERYNAAILKIAAQEECLLLDIRSAFLQTPDYRDYICVDGIHPNAAGQDLMCAEILTFIKNRAEYLLI